MGASSAARSLLMPEIVADSSPPCYYLLFSGSGIQEYQQLDPDPLSPRARRSRAFCEGKLRRSAGRPTLRNPKRRVPNLAARPLSAPVLSELLERKPLLLRP